MSSSGVYEDDYEQASDDGSLYADSPSDGYFNHREHPQETFVEQSSVQAESEAKAREAAESRASSSPTLPSSHVSTNASARETVWANENTPLLDAGPAPPDYAAATANRTRAQEPSRHVAGSSQHSRLSSYGSINSSQPDTHVSDEQSERQWPLGNQGSPFSSNFPFGPRSNPSGHDSHTINEQSERQWPLGSQGNPFGSNFPFGPRSSPFGHGSQPGNSDGPFSTNGQPQSMRDGRADEERGTSARASQSPTRRGWQRRWQRVGGCCRPTSILNIFLALLVIGLILLLARVTRQASRSGVPSGGDHKYKLPVQDGGGNGDIGRDNNRTIPAHPANSRCAFNFYSESISFDFKDPGSFSFTEMMKPASYMPGGISGNIWILPAPADQDVPIRVWVSYATTEPIHITNMDYDFTHESLQLRFPKMEKSYTGYAGKSCMDVGVGIYVRSDVELGDWQTSTANLNVEVEEGLFGSKTNLAASGLWLANTTTINAVAGHVKMAYWSSRKTVVDVVSGSVSGTYALRDLLSIRTRSGSIKVKVEPKSVSATKPAPAEFTAVSSSGSVQIDFPLDGEIPDRDYRTRVESSSSSVSGTYIHGSTTIFQTNSGSIHADVLPYYAKPDEASTLRTETSSGTTNLCLLPPFKQAGSAISRLHSHHLSTSGSINLAYPQEWEGTIEGETTSGSINLKGKDVHTYYDGAKSAYGKRLVARKGHGNSKLGFRSYSGSVTLKVGDT